MVILILACESSGSKGLTQWFQVQLHAAVPQILAIAEGGDEVH